MTKDTPPSLELGLNPPEAPEPNEYEVKLVQQAYLIDALKAQRDDAMNKLADAQTLIALLTIK